MSRLPACKQCAAQEFLQWDPDTVDCTEVEHTGLVLSDEDIKIKLPKQSGSRLSEEELKILYTGPDIVEPTFDEMRPS